MSLIITNKILSKSMYEFGVDDNYIVEFSIKSDGKEYSLNEIYILFGYKIDVGEHKYTSKLEKITLSGPTIIGPNDEKNFNATIPIKIPNTKKDIIEYHEIKLKNYVKIVADIKLNPFDCSLEIFPNIHISRNKWSNVLLQNEGKNEHIEKLQQELESLTLYKDENIKKELGQKIDNLEEDFDSGKIDNIEYFEKLDFLFTEQDNNIEFKDKQRAEEILKELKTASQFDTSEDEKNGIQYYKVEDSGFDFIDDKVNAEVYDFLKKKFFSFRIGEIFRTNIILRKLNKGMIFLFPLSVIYIFLYGIFDESNNVKPQIFSLLDNYIFPLFIITGSYLLFGYLFSKTGKKSMNKLTDIQFGNLNNIKSKLLDGIITFDDIFKDIKVKYDGNYSCEFSAHLSCILKVGLTEGSGKSASTYFYDKEIFSTLLGEYNGKDIKTYNINKFSSLNAIKDILIKPGYIYGSPNFFKFSSDFGKISYKISYQFISKDLPDKFGEISLD